MAQLYSEVSSSNALKSNMQHFMLRFSKGIVSLIIALNVLQFYRDIHIDRLSIIMRCDSTPSTSLWLPIVSIIVFMPLLMKLCSAEDHNLYTFKRGLLGRSYYSQLLSIRTLSFFHFQPSTFTAMHVDRVNSFILVSPKTAGQFAIL